jgi:WW domain-containing oxidoreductase
MSLYGWLQPKGPNGFGYRTTAAEVVDGLDLAGKTYLVTGCNSGLGAEVMRVLCGRGATVVGAARTLEKATAACAPFGDHGLPVACELSEPDSVRAAVAAVHDLPELDGVIANAGIMALPERKVQHGLELQFLTNHIGHFILVTGLLERLTDQARVVILSSSAHSRAYPEGIRFDDLDAAREYTAWGAYGQSKLANLLFSNELSKRLQGSRTSNACHPGVIQTNLGRHMDIPMAGLLGPLLNAVALKSVPEGAATETYLAVHPACEGVSGAYFADCNPIQPTDLGQDDALGVALWEKTEALIAGL